MAKLVSCRKWKQIYENKKKPNRIARSGTGRREADGKGNWNEMMTENRKKYRNIRRPCDVTCTSMTEIMIPLLQPLLPREWLVCNKHYGYVALSAPGHRRDSIEILWIAILCRLFFFCSADFDEVISSNQIHCADGAPIGNWLPPAIFPIFIVTFFKWSMRL